MDFYNFSGIKLCVCQKKKKKTKEEESLLKGEGGLKGKGAKNSSAQAVGVEPNGIGK